jgi:hypothetical protein
VVVVVAVVRRAVIVVSGSLAQQTSIIATTESAETRMIDSFIARICFFNHCLSQVPIKTFKNGDRHFLWLSELAFVLVRFGHVARLIQYADHGIM